MGRGAGGLQARRTGIGADEDRPYLSTRQSGAGLPPIVQPTPGQDEEAAHARGLGARLEIHRANVWRRRPRNGVAAAHRRLVRPAARPHRRAGSSPALKIWRALWGQCKSISRPNGRPTPRATIRHSASAGALRSRATPFGSRARPSAWSSAHGGWGITALRLRWRWLGTRCCCRSTSAAHALATPGGTDGPVFRLARAKTGKAAMARCRSAPSFVLKACLATLPKDLHPSAPIFRTPPFQPAKRWQAASGRYLPRRCARPAFSRCAGSEISRRLSPAPRLPQIRCGRGQGWPGRSRGAGGQDGQLIDKNRGLQDTYLPPSATVVRIADEARTRGRARLRGRTAELDF